MKFKKLVVIGITLSMLVGLTACGSNKKSGGESTAQNTEAEPVVEKTEDVETENAAEEENAEAEPEFNTDWPNGTVTITCCYAAGGDTDACCRVVADWLTEYFGETFVVTNITGAGGATAAIEVMGKEPDGYNILFNHNSTSFATAAGSYDFSFNDDLDTIASVADGSPSVLVCLKDNPYGWENMEDVLAYVKEHPGEVTISDVAGTATAVLPGGLEQEGYILTKLDCGTSGIERFTAMLGGQVDLSGVDILVAKDYIASGEVIPLTSNGFEHYDYGLGFDVPSIAADLGFENSADRKYYKMYFPKGTPKEIHEKLCYALEQMCEDPEFISAMEVNNCVANFDTAEEVIQKEQEDIEKYTEMFFSK